MALSESTFEELFNYTRPGDASYENEAGDIVTVGADVPRFEYLDGIPQGLKFGDGDVCTTKPELQLFSNNLGGVLVFEASTYYEDVALRLWKDGSVLDELEGVNGDKTYIYNVAYSDIPDYIEIVCGEDDGRPRWARDAACTMK